MTQRDPESRVESLFRRLLDKPEATRVEQLATIERESPELAARVQRMLDLVGETTLESLVGTPDRDDNGGPSFSRGDELGRFVLERPLGAGGMGTVWRAYDRSLDRSVAIKVLNPQLFGDEKAQSRFRREARALAALAHPGVAAVHDVGQSNNVEFLAMELVDGAPIDQFVRERGAGVDLILGLAIQITEALRACHVTGVVHRDLKPSNILVTHDGRVKLVDFGLAKGLERVGSGDSLIDTLTQSEALTADGALLGTPDHMAPEQALARPVDARGDFFSLGVTLYELLAGENPFRREGLVATITAIINDREPSLSRTARVPPEVAALVHRCLEKSPEDRPANADELLEGLASLVRTRTDRLYRWRLRSAAWIASVPWRTVTALAVGITVVAVTAWQARDAVGVAAYQSVAVIPLERVGDSRVESEDYGAGLARALNSKLSRVEGLRVVPWSDVRNADPTSLNLENLVRQFAVDAIVLGRYEIEGGRLTMVIEIIDGKTGLQVASSEFSRLLDESALLQNDVAIDTMQKFIGELSDADRTRLIDGATDEVEAFHFYMRGAEKFREQAAGADIEARALLTNALTLDPDLAEAHEALAVVLSQGYFEERYPEADLESAIDQYRLAIELEPVSVPARRGLIRAYWQLGRTEEIVALFEAGLPRELRPVDRALLVADGLLFTGLEDVAVEWYERALEHEPANRSALWQAVVASAWARDDVERVRTLAERYTAAFGRDAELLYWLAVTESLNGDVARAGDLSVEILDLAETTPVRPAIRVFVSKILQDAGQLERSDTAVLDAIFETEHRLQSGTENGLALVSLAHAHGIIGDAEGVDTYINRLNSVSTSPHCVLYEGSVAELALGRRARAAQMVDEAMDRGFVPSGRLIEHELIDAGVLQLPSWARLRERNEALTTGVLARMRATGLLDGDNGNVH